MEQKEVKDKANHGRKMYPTQDILYCVVIVAILLRLKREGKPLNDSYPKLIASKLKASEEYSEYRGGMMQVLFGIASAKEYGLLKSLGKGNLGATALGEQAAEEYERNGRLSSELMAKIFLSANLYKQLYSQFGEDRIPENGSFVEVLTKNYQLTHNIRPEDFRKIAQTYRSVISAHATALRKISPLTEALQEPDSTKKSEEGTSPDTLRDAIIDLAGLTMLGQVNDQRVLTDLLFKIKTQLDGYKPPRKRKQEYYAVKATLDYMLSEIKREPINSRLGYLVNELGKVGEYIED